MAKRHNDLLRGVRHPDRVRSSQLIERLVRDFKAVESPDPALIVGTGSIDGIEVLVLGQEKPNGQDADQARQVNFGMMNAAGYWFAIEQLEAAAVQGRAVVTFIDTPGADPSTDGIEQLLAWAVSASISAFIAFRGPSVSVLIGEGGSGGALALQVADRRLMVSDAFFSVISPESCSAILFRDHDHIPEAMAVLKPGAESVKTIGVVDEIVEWPGEVAATDYDRAAELLREPIVRGLRDAAAPTAGTRPAHRTELLYRCGRVRGDAKALMAPLPPSAARPPKRRRFTDVDSDDDGVAALRQAYFAEQGLGDDWEAHPPRLLCPPQRGGCGATFTQDAYEAAYWACPSCGRGERLGAGNWSQVLCDPDSFEELWSELDLPDLDDSVYDNETYRNQRQELRRTTGAHGSMSVGRARIGTLPCVVALSDFGFMGGTLSTVAGEKFRLICEVARQERLPLVSLVCSGGVRMQDGTLGLAQMAKTNAAAAQLMEAGLPHITIMADPCTGGAMASYATCATAVLAEPRALLSFAGPRVLRLAGLPVDEASLVGESYAQYGGIDEVVPRTQMRERLAHYIGAGSQLNFDVGLSNARRRRSLARRRVSAWFGDIRSRLSSVIHGERGLLLAEANELVQANVVAELASLARDEIPALLAQASQSSHARVRANAITALASLPLAGAEAMERALTDSHHRVRAEAALGLLQRDPSHGEAQRAAQHLLDSQDAATRRHGLYVATRVPIAAFAPQVERLCSDSDSAVRLAAGLATAAGGDIDAAVEVLKPLVGDGRGRTRWRVEPQLTMISADLAQQLRSRLGLE